MSSDRKYQVNKWWDWYCLFLFFNLVFQWCYTTIEFGSIHVVYYFHLSCFLGLKSYNYLFEVLLNRIELVGILVFLGRTGFMYKILTWQIQIISWGQTGVTELLLTLPLLAGLVAVKANSSQLSPPETSSMKQQPCHHPQGLQGPWKAGLSLAPTGGPTHCKGSQVSLSLGLWVVYCRFNHSSHRDIPQD